MVSLTLSIELVPSSARSVSSAASPLPTQLVPLLEESLDKLKEIIGKVLPVSKNRTALEEAEWEDESSEGALERELMMQSMETLRIYRPRVILHGPLGMGQGYIAAAALHFLEGYHVQSLDLGSLMSDSTRVRPIGPVHHCICLILMCRHLRRPSFSYLWKQSGISHPLYISLPWLVGVLLLQRPHVRLCVPCSTRSRLPTQFCSWRLSTARSPSFLATCANGSDQIAKTVWG